MKHLYSHPSKNPDKLPKMAQFRALSILDYMRMFNQKSFTRHEVFSIAGYAFFNKNNIVNYYANTQFQTVINWLINNEYIIRNIYPRNFTGTPLSGLSDEEVEEVINVGLVRRKDYFKNDKTVSFELTASGKKMVLDNLHIIDDNKYNQMSLNFDLYYNMFKQYKGIDIKNYIYNTKRASSLFAYTTLKNDMEPSVDRYHSYYNLHLTTFSRLCEAKKLGTFKNGILHFS